MIKRFFPLFFYFLNFNLVKCQQKANISPAGVLAKLGTCLLWQKKMHNESELTLLKISLMILQHITSRVC